MGHEHLHAFHHLIIGYVECVLTCTSCAALNSIDTEEYPLGVEKYTINTNYCSSFRYNCTVSYCDNNVFEPLELRVSPCQSLLILVRNQTSTPNELFLTNASGEGAPGALMLQPLPRFAGE